MTLEVGEATRYWSLLLKLKAWADATDAAIAAITGITDGDKGDITVSASGATWTIDNKVVTFAKMQDVTGLSVPGVAGSSTAALAAITAGTNGHLLGRLSNALAFAALSSYIDAIGSTQGQVLYRGASTWDALGAGTVGQLLKTGGASANPSWFTPGALLGTATTTSGATQTVSSIPQAPGFLCVFNGVSHNNGSNQSIRVEISDNNGTNWGTAKAVTAAVSAATMLHGAVLILGTGVASTTKVVSPNVGAAGAASTFRDTTTEATRNGITNALRFSPSAGSFDAGSITVWGIG